MTKPPPPPIDLNLKTCPIIHRIAVLLKEAHITYLGLGTEIVMKIIFLVLSPQTLCWGTIREGEPPVM